MNNPRILILDDSSSALDYATDSQLRRALKKRRGTTTFIVSQRIACVRDSDIILVLDNGRLAGRGTHAQLLGTCDTYRDIYYSQFPKETEKAENARATESSPTVSDEIAHLRSDDAEHRYSEEGEG